MINEMMNERTATDMAAYFLSKEGSGRMHYKKLMGLMYLSERKNMEEHGDFIYEDDFEAKEHGPVRSETYKLMEGRRKSSAGGWSSMINELDGEFISVKEKVDLDDVNELWKKKLGYLNKPICKIMDEIWEDFGHFSEQELRRYIRYNCPEWKVTRRLNEGKESNSNQITVDTIGKEIGFDKDDIDEIKYYTAPWQWV